MKRRFLPSSRHHFGQQQLMKILYMQRKGLLMHHWCPMTLICMHLCSGMCLSLRGVIN